MYIKSPAYAVTLLLIVATAGMCQQPTAVITGPKTATAGDLVVLDASQSQGLGYLWLLVNSDKSFLPVDNGLRCVFASAAKGKYIFVLVVSGTNANGGPAAATTTHTLTLDSNMPGPIVVDPITPPQPQTLVASAVILLETGDLTADQAQVLNQLRNEPIAAKVKILDKETPSAAVARAVEYVKDKSLPVVIAVKANGSFESCETLPADLAAVLALLTKWGIKP